MRLRTLLVAALLATGSQAQQTPNPLREVYALIDRATDEISQIEAAIEQTENRLTEWQNRARNSQERGRILAEEAAFLDVGTQIADHPLAKQAGAACQDEYRVAGLPGYAVNEQRIAECARETQLRVRHAEPLECSNLYWTMDGTGALHLVGHVKSDDDLAHLRTRFGEALTRDVAARPFPVCAALDVLELPMSSAQVPTIQLLSGQRKVAYGQSLAFQVTTPDFYAFLYVVYMQADGSVVNLMPRRRLMRQQQAPNTTLLFGDGLQGRQTFTAGAPPGAEAIIVIAARSPIQTLDDLEDEGDGQFKIANGAMDQVTFLGMLEASLDDRVEAREGRREIAAGVFHLDVVP